MPTPMPVTLFHSPNTRSTGALILIEELGADVALHLLDMKAGEQRRPEYLAVNPMGKVPALRHGDALVTEQAAVFMYLAELFPQRGLAPLPGDALRGPYLRWMTFYGSCFEPAVVDRALKREAASPSTLPYGDFDTMLGTLEQHMAASLWMLGEGFSTADVLWGSALTWIVGFKLVPERPIFKAYLERFNARPAVIRARERDAELAAPQDAARPAT
jgi:glutathione S-transferase